MAICGRSVLQRDRLGEADGRAAAERHQAVGADALHFGQRILGDVDRRVHGGVGIAPAKAPTAASASPSAFWCGVVMTNTRLAPSRSISRDSSLQRAVAEHHAARQPSIDERFHPGRPLLFAMTNMLAFEN